MCPTNTPKLSNIVTASEITDNDVLCGRGRALQSHTGNMRFRDLVVERSAAYGDNPDNKLLRRNVALEIMSIVQRKGGRFLKRIPAGGTGATHSAGVSEEWKVAEPVAALTKVKQALRDTVFSSRREAASKTRSSPESRNSTTIAQARHTQQGQTNATSPAFDYLLSSQDNPPVSHSASFLERRASPEQEHARLMAQAILLEASQRQGNSQRTEVITPDLMSVPRLSSNQLRQSPLTHSTWAFSNLLQQHHVQSLMMPVLSSHFSSPLRIRNADILEILLRASMMNVAPTIGQTGSLHTAGIDSTSNRPTSPNSPRLQSRRRLFASRYPAASSPSSDRPC